MHLGPKGTAPLSPTSNTSAPPKSYSNQRYQTYPNSTSEPYVLQKGPVTNSPTMNTNTTSGSSSILESNVTNLGYSGDNPSISVSGSASSCSPTVAPNDPHDSFNKVKKQRHQYFQNQQPQVVSHFQQYPQLQPPQYGVLPHTPTFDSTFILPSYLSGSDQKLVKPESTIPIVAANSGTESHESKSAAIVADDQLQRQHFSNVSGDPKAYQQLQNIGAAVFTPSHNATYFQLHDKNTNSKASRFNTTKKVKPARRTFYVDEDEVSSDDKHSSLIVSSTKHANLNKEDEVCNQASEDLGNPMNYTTTSNQTTSIANSVANNVGVLEHDDRFSHHINSNSKTDHAAFQSQSCSFQIQSHKGIETSDNMSTLSASADPTTSPKTTRGITTQLQSNQPNLQNYENESINVKAEIEVSDDLSLEQSQYIPGEIMEMTNKFITDMNNDNNSCTSGPAKAGSTKLSDNKVAKNELTQNTNNSTPLTKHKIPVKSQNVLQKSQAIDKKAHLKRAHETQEPTKPENTTNPDYPEAIAEMENFYECFPSLRESYKLIDKIGEGAFSTVYKAIDLCYDAYSNDWDNGYSESVYSRYRKADRKDQMIKEIKNYKMYGIYPKIPSKYVAIKRIHVTAHPRRIASELSLLKRLSGCPNLLPLITGTRYEDQVIAVMPYFEHHDFRDFYSDLSISELRVYFKQLFNALAFIHEQDIIHRDVKAQNFLYNLHTHRGVLVDFGLAERVSPTRKIRCECTNGGLSRAFPEFDSNISPKRPARADSSSSVSSASTTGGFPLTKYTDPTRASTQPTSSSTRKSRTSGIYANAATTAAVVSNNCINSGKPVIQGGKPRNDTRHTRRFSRAGTRGFRAPEVLFGCPDQTVSIDIWSAGIMLLSFLTKRCIFFQAKDDSRALIEMATIFGIKKMRKTALLHGMIYETTIPTIPQNGYDLEVLINWCLAAHYKFKDAGKNAKAQNSSDPSSKRRKKEDNTDQSKQGYSSSLPQYIDKDTRKAVDFLKTCLELDFRERTTAASALQHPFLKNAKLDIPIYGEDTKEGYLDYCDTDDKNTPLDPVDVYLQREHAKMLREIDQKGPSEGQEEYLEEWQEEMYTNGADDSYLSHDADNSKFIGTFVDSISLNRNDDNKSEGIPLSKGEEEDDFENQGTDVAESIADDDIIHNKSHDSQNSDVDDKEEAPNGGTSFSFTGDDGSLVQQKSFDTAPSHINNIWDSQNALQHRGDRTVSKSYSSFMGGKSYIQNRGLVSTFKGQQLGYEKDCETAHRADEEGDGDNILQFLG